MSTYSYMLDFVLEEYPSSKIIHCSDYTDITKLTTKVKKEVKKEDLPHGILVVKGQDVILETLLQKLEVSNHHLKVNSYPGFLVLEMVESGVHSQLCRELQNLIHDSLRDAALNVRFAPRVNAKVYQQPPRRYPIMPDVSFQPDTRVRPTTPSLVVEVSVKQSIKSITNRILDWLSLPRRQGNRVDIVIGVKADFERRQDDIERPRSSSILHQRLRSVTFSVYLSEELNTTRQGIRRLVERQTVKILVWEENRAVLTRISADPVCLLARRSDFKTRNPRRRDLRPTVMVPAHVNEDITVPHDVLTGRNGHDVVLLSLEQLQNVVRWAFKEHENEVQDNDQFKGYI